VTTKIQGDAFLTRTIEGIQGGALLTRAFRMPSENLKKLKNNYSENKTTKGSHFLDTSHITGPIKSY